MNRSIILFLAVLFLIILGFALILTGGHGNKKTPANSGPAIMALPDYSNTDATTSLTIGGIVNGDEMHRQIRITIGSEERKVDIIQGYGNNVINTQSFYNNPDAYGVFLRSISYAGFLNAIKKPAVTSNPAGQCPLGNTFIYQLNQEGETLSNLWSSTCGVKVGTLGGNSNLLQTLFQNQIPNYNTITQNVNLAATTTTQ